MDLDFPKSYSCREYTLSEALKSFNYYDRLFGFFGSLIVNRTLYHKSLQSNLPIISNNYLNKLTAWSVLSGRNTLQVASHFNFTPIAKRCTGPFGSYFQSNIELQVQTFIYDQAFIYLSFSSTQTHLMQLGLNRSLCNLRTLCKYKISGADFLEITFKLFKMNCPINYLLLTSFFFFIPSSLLKLLLSIYKTWRH